MWTGSPSALPEDVCDALPAIFFIWVCKSHNAVILVSQNEDPRALTAKHYKVEQRKRQAYKPMAVTYPYLHADVAEDRSHTDETTLAKLKLKSYGLTQIS